MRVAVLGGKLQGVEACYLAQKAGWQVVLVDKKPDVPALGFCDEFFCFDLMEEDKLRSVLSQVDFAIPALEDKLVLDHIEAVGQAVGVRVMYDKASYELSSSKIASDKLFAELNIPAPRPWPDASFPLTVKPSDASGSEHVYRVRSAAELAALKNKLGEEGEWVIQEFLTGPSYSLEVIGCQGRYHVFQVTELEMDNVYDCKRVMAPAVLGQTKKNELHLCLLKLAGKLKLNGIMDIEVILHENKLKVLEIDARLPSQTLITVYQSTGINILEAVWQSFDNPAAFRFPERPRGVIYEHVKVTAGKLEVWGEHIMGNVGRLHLKKGFFGADEAITNYDKRKKEWVATLIITADSLDMAWQKRTLVINAIMADCKLREYQDLTPPSLPNSAKRYMIRDEVI
ncbi:MAG: 3-methylornithine--L-lysine ligase PylC [Pelosinus sp.]|nr:3-methylornithine--L-lysine ligase PylC [Pelosinus sp.]